MTFAIHVPSLPKVPLERCDDSERKIGRRCWDLHAVQAALSQQKLSLYLTANAQEQASSQLNWNLKQVRGFLESLTLTRYNSSEWCLPPTNGNKFGPLVADSYLMGYDKIFMRENQSRVPYTYFKFAVQETTNAVLILSCHPSQF
jgi:hypothetical protein